MSRPWLVLALVLGAVIGWFLARGNFGEDARPESAAADTASNPPAAQTTPPPAPASAPADTSGSPPPGAGPAVSGAVPGAQAQPPEYTGYHKAIDVGPVFRQQFDYAITQGGQDAIYVAHRDVEREIRDDSWAYGIESEIESSLLTETTVGNFRREHVECRATLCEVRLSGEGDDQATALQNWHENLGGQRWSSRLVIIASSTQIDNGKVHTLAVFRKQSAVPPSR